MVNLSKGEISFPDPEIHDPDGGLLAFGGDLSPERLLFAYRNGIFPWFNEGEEILWWCPDPRFVLFPDSIKISKSMKKILMREEFLFTENKNFREVINKCSRVPRSGQSGTWISSEMISSYCQLHEMGFAKSLEVWQNDTLVGGFYGVEIGRVFCGESMFSEVSNASKAGFIHFVKKYSEKYSVIDCQVHSAHLESLGAGLIPKREFLKFLKL